IRKKQDLEDLKHNKHKYEEIKNKHLAVMQHISMIRGKIAEIDKQILLLQAEKEKKEKVMKKKEKLEQIVHFLESKFIPLIDSIEKKVMSSINMQFNAYFKEWFEQLLEHTDLRADIDETFTPVIKQEGGYTIDYVHLSGGEKTSVALAYRLALNKIMNQLIDTIQTKDLLILDEPTDGFSSEQIQNMRELLEKLNLKQIIIVSHEEMVKDIADHIIKLKKINGATQIYG
ncbi:MAG: SMC family ATPase, partial [Candidatus Nanohaloarchaeota archaeon]|nr:SMC family ATPase [Candidatus Nanohaloarchaeota archaeon]